MMGHSVTWPRVLPGFAFALLIAALHCSIAVAAISDSDGVYGRLDGDIGISPNLGVQVSRGQAEPALGLQAMYVSTFGIGLTHADTRLLFGAQSVDRSVTSVEFKLCPLFLSRWSQAWELLSQTYPLRKRLKIDPQRL